MIDLQSNSTVNETYYGDTVSKKDDTFGVYTILVILKATLGLVKYYALLRFCRSASINIHRAMSSRVVNALMSFFDTHFIGNILNRFSLDLSNIDESLPFVFPGLFGVSRMLEYFVFYFNTTLIPTEVKHEFRCYRSAIFLLNQLGSDRNGNKK